MTERAAALKCPKCGRREVDTLASTDSVFRYQCKTLACFHEWIVCLERTPADLMAERNHTAEQREETMAASFKCSKCDTTFDSARSRGQHQRYCKPTKVKLMDGTRDRVVFSEKGVIAGSITENVLAMLKEKRDERVILLTVGDEQLQEIDSLIERVKVRA
jgi:transposase-like protein